MSARRLSALFPLGKFCSVANVNFKCLAWYVCLEFLYDKNMYYKIVWDLIFLFSFLVRLGKFYYFFKNNNFSSKHFHRLSKKGY